MHLCKKKPLGRCITSAATSSTLPIPMVAAQHLTNPEAATLTEVFERMLTVSR
jgi:hypothetical protein